MPERVGIVGVPPLAVIARLNREGAEIVDLDEPLSQMIEIGRASCRERV